MPDKQYVRSFPQRYSLSEACLVLLAPTGAGDLDSVGVISRDKAQCGGERTRKQKLYGLADGSAPNEHATRVDEVGVAIEWAL